LGIKHDREEPLSQWRVGGRVERAIREIGLTEYESLAYMALVESGELTAGDISSTTSIPYSKIYSVLDSLERKGWIEIKGGRPRLYYPKAPVEALRSERLRQESTFEQLQEVIVAELQPVFERRKIKEKPEIWIVRGAVNIASSINEVVGRARRELMVALPLIPQDLLQMVFPAFKSLQDRTVDIKLLTTRESSSFVEKYMAHMATVKVRDEMFGGGIVADGRESLLFLSEGKGDPKLIAIFSDHVGLTTIAKVYFEYLWNTAELLRPT
jgi:sugar-specific transcriptional regulator TrmB